MKNLPLLLLPFLFFACQQTGTFVALSSPQPGILTLEV
jgi:hypothetical protein